MTKYTPHVIVALDDDGQMYLELFDNGARTKRYLTETMEAVELRAALYRERDKALERAKVERERESLIAKARSNKVWSQTARNFGAAFANKNIGPKPKEVKTAVPKVTAASLRDLI